MENQSSQPEQKQMHRWFIYCGVETCKFCGVIKRLGRGKNSPCRGGNFAARQNRIEQQKPLLNGQEVKNLHQKIKRLAAEASNLIPKNGAKTKPF